MGAHKVYMVVVVMVFRVAVGWAKCVFYGIVAVIYPMYKPALLQSGHDPVQGYPVVLIAQIGF
jgi:hypothetical protein